MSDPFISLQGCPPCSETTSGSISIGFKGKAGAIISGSLSGGKEIYPQSNPFQGDVKIEIGAWAGAEICATLSGKIKKTVVLN